MANNNAVYSTMVRSGRTTYFIDVKKAKNSKKYMQITESRIDVDSKKSRSTIRVFAESIEQFRQAVDEAASSAKQ